jgi:hypothetical protein
VTTPPDAALARMLATAADRSLAWLRATDPDLAGELDGWRRAPHRPAVVVVGETSRGKSALVNALIGVPDLVPVSPAAGTATYVELRHGDRTAARAYLPDRPDPVPLDLADLRDWATTGGRLPDGARRPRHIEVTHPAPLLAELTLVDTPGAGGLDPALAEVSLDAAARGSALLFVADAAAPLSRPELDLLAAASDRVDVVVFALTKVDAYPSWRTILADNRALLAAHAPRFTAAGWLPVSAHLATLAATLPAGAGGTEAGAGGTEAGAGGTEAVAGGTEAVAAQAAELARAAGVDRLRRVLRDLAGRAEQARQANVVRAVRSELARLERATADRIRAADGDPGALAAAGRDRANRVAADRAEARRWALTLRTEVERARLELAARVRTEVGAAQEQLLDRIDRGRGAALTGLPDEVDRHLHAVSVRLSRELAATFDAVVDRVLAAAAGPDEARRLRGEVHAALRDRDAGRERRLRTGPDDVMVALSASELAYLAGRGVVAGASALGAGTVLGIGLLVPAAGIGLCLAAGAFALYHRRVAADRQQARLWLREVLAEARAAVTEEIARRFTDLHHALALALDTAAERRQRRLDDERAELERAAAADGARRAARRAELARERESLRGRLAQLDEVLARAAGLGTIRQPAAQAGD